MRFFFGQIGSWDSTTDSVDGFEAIGFKNNTADRQNHQRQNSQLTVYFVNFRVDKLTWLISQDKYFTPGAFFLVRSGRGITTGSVDPLRP